MFFFSPRFVDDPMDPPWVFATRNRGSVGGEVAEKIRRQMPYKPTGNMWLNLNMWDL